MTLENQIKQRRAIEALRSGVPNRDAVEALGCTQPNIEERFRQQLENIRQSNTDGSKNTGILVEGDFGTGKSHLLEYLMHLALRENFVCSKIVISKETPFYDPVKMYRAAIETAMVPGKRGDALTEIATKLDFNSQAYNDLYLKTNRGSELNSRFAATLFLYQRMHSDQESLNRIIRFWSGERIGVGEIKRDLKACRESVTYKIEPIPARELALQRFKFASQLMVAAGYSGWVLLIDEIELIGRYSLMKRAESYAELARWMGKLEESNFAGVTTLLTITTDFQSAILEGKKNDLEKVPGRLRSRTSEGDLLLAGQAERGMRIIQGEKIELNKPDNAMLKQTYDKIRNIHATAYNWEPPQVSSAEQQGTTTSMRQYVRGWITEWDLKYLDPKYKPQIEVTELKPDYTEDRDLEVGTEENSEIVDPNQG
jgi:hypothetical protein